METFAQYRPTPFLFDSTSENAESSFEVYFTMPEDKTEKHITMDFVSEKKGLRKNG